MSLTIIKLGGSLVTDKHSGRPVLRAGVVRRLSRELIALRRSGDLRRCILLHGAGSFGHPFVFFHRLEGRRLSSATIPAVGRTIQEVGRLNASLAEEFLRLGLPVVPLQTATMVTVHRHRQSFRSQAIIQTILRSGGVPLLGGDLALSDDQRSVVVSADSLAVMLANQFAAPRVVFCTDVDGVYLRFPPAVGQRPLPYLNRHELRQLVRQPLPKRQRTDVTGAMIGKLRAIQELRQGTAFIVNGGRPGRLSSVFHARPRGTIIDLGFIRKSLHGGREGRRV